MAFETVKNNLVRAKLVRLLTAIVAAGANGMFVSEKDADQLASGDGTMVEVNKAAKDEKGNVAIRATAAGTAAVAAIAAAAAAAPPAAPEPKQSFTIESGVALPAIKRGGANRTNQYPFDQLEAQQSFFVASTEKRPNPAKSLASTVSSANKRYKGATPIRKFTVRAVDGGARVWRTA